MNGDDTGTGDRGRRLRAHRLRAGLTQEELARVSGISVRGIRLVESGKRRPRAATVTVLADSLRLSAGERTALMEAVWPEARSAAKPVPVVPRQLPPPPHGFAARKSEIAWLDSILSREQGRLGCVTGTGGIGKTWLAVHWANGCAERFPDGQLYLNLRGFDPVAEPVSTRSALRSMLVALGTPAAVLPAGAEDLAALFRGATAGRRVLLLLDNARDAVQVAPLLPGGADCLTIVTSRDSLRGLDIDHGAGLLRLDSLADTAAAEVLARRLGAERMDREPAAAAAVVAACAGLPLALGIVAAQASRYPDHPLSALAEELLRRADRLHRRGGEHGLWEEINLDDLGEVLRARGREAEAVAAWERSACLSEAAHRYSAARKVRAKIAGAGATGLFGGTVSLCRISFLFVPSRCEDSGYFFQ